ncbi:IS3 family transposase [Bacillus thuringiensis]|uniref:IS3 family transposase n=1 Tax=Bacillus thuringiensis TaxID=1428 RepID=A0A9W3YKT0_BACTU|nr:IS3 family transposase [Bacillus thuringiensis]MCU4825203.1 IS3 family transposase [Bacillus cereus]AYF85307.1 IS3 family transposase [Bacillus thuringiensis]EEM80503.1 Integrase [Bacillus thuringiensis serovar huazhongensis BGSC 4BD1]MCU4858059.1 IS3 family transposase [Bacillus cereus]MCU4874800.1 IS3 family transposase [Bacillus cereus]
MIKGTKHIKRHKGLEEKRGKAKGLGLGRPRTKPEDSEAKIKRLEAENEMLETGYTVTLLCAIAGVNRSGYYKWIKRHAVPSKRKLADTAFKKKILECHTKLRGIYEYRRIQVWLKATYNFHLNHKRIQRLMSELGIKAIIRKKRPYYGKKEAYLIPDNHLNRDFQASRPNEKWVTDITYLIFNGQRLYLSAIKDLYNNEIVAYEISRRNDLKLVLDTLKKAKKKRHVKGILLHSDPGFQYTSRQYNQLLKKISDEGKYVSKGQLLG